MIKRVLVVIVLIIAVVAALALQMGGKGTVNGDPLATTGAVAPTLEQSPDLLDILIFGGTSGIGLETVKLALERGHKVTSVARRPERMPVEHQNLVNHKGDITKIESFADLILGKSAVISAIGLKPSRKPVTVYSRGMENILEVANREGVERILTITGIGAGDSKGHGGLFYDRILNPLLLKADYADKTRQEEIIQSSSANWTIVRPGFLIDEASNKEYRVLTKTEGLVSGSISRSDVAHFLIAAIEQNSYVGSTVFLSN